MAAPRLKALIVGSGHAGIDLHFRAYAAHPDVEVVGFCDRDLDAAKAARKRTGTGKAFDDLEAAIGKLRPDIVSVTTPPKTHLAIAEQCLGEGRTVLVEKPIFPTVDEAHEARRLVAERGGTLVPVHNQREQPGVRAAVELMRAGRLGAVQHVNAYWMLDGRRNTMTKDPNHWSHQLTGGRWEELVPHRIYVPYRFVGKMTLEHLEMMRTDACPEWMPSDEVLIVLRADAAWVTIRLSSNTRKWERFEVIGAKRAIGFKGSRIWGLGPEEGPLSKREIPATAASHLQRPRKGLLRRRVSPGKHAAFIHTVVAAAQGHCDFPVDWDEAINTLELTAEIGTEIARQAELLTG